MTLKKEYQMEPGPGRESIAQAETTQQGEELGGSVGQTKGSAARTIQNTLQQTKNTAGAIMKTVADGLETSAEYLTDRRYAGVLDDLKSLIRHYPLPAFLIGSSLGFLLSRSWRRSRTDLREKGTR